MKDSSKGWIAGLVFILVVVAVPIWIFTRVDAAAPGQVIDTPWEHMPRRAAPVDHKDLFTGPFETGQEVTAACLDCHPDSAKQVIHTAHWRWQSEPVLVEGRDEPISTIH